MNARWIAVEDRLPEAPKSRWSQDVLVCNTRGHVDVDSYYNAGDGDGFWLIHRRGESENPRCAGVTHWMPLPDRPEADAQKESGDESKRDMGVNAFLSPRPDMPYKFKEAFDLHHHFPCSGCANRHETADFCRTCAHYVE